MVRMPPRRRQVELDLETTHNQCETGQLPSAQGSARGVPRWNRPGSSTHDAQAGLSRDWFVMMGTLLFVSQCPATNGKPEAPNIPSTSRLPGEL